MVGFTSAITGIVVSAVEKDAWDCGCGGGILEVDC